MKNQPGTMKTDLEPWQPNLEPWKTMKTDLEVDVELDLRQLGKVLIFRYGRQGLAGSLGQGYSQAGTFWCVLNVSLHASGGQLGSDIVDRGKA